MYVCAKVKEKGFGQGVKINKDIMSPNGLIHMERKVSWTGRGYKDQKELTRTHRAA